MKAVVWMIVCGLGLAGSAAAQQARPKGADRVLAAERAFARAAASEPLAEVMLRHLDPEGLLFQPQPVHAAEWIAAHRAAWSGTLTAVPTDLRIARSRDLAYTVGPSWHRGADGRETTGSFLTVWRVQPDSSYRILLDAVVDHAFAAPPDTTSIRYAVAAAPVVCGPDPDLDLELEALLEIDRAGAGAAVAPYARLHREGAPPLSGAEAVRAAGAGQGAEPVGGGLSRSVDLAYTYGRLAEPSGGYYVRLWTREPEAGWLLAEEVRLPPTAP